jgi:hypothetical protein
MKNLIIDTGDRLDKDIQEFKVSAVEKEKNFTSARIRVCRDPKTLSPMIFYSQELNRNFKNPSDPMSMRHIVKSFEPDHVNASTDTALEFKFNDAMLAHRSRIDEYNPLTDIHSNEMNLFVDEDSATYLSDMGIDIDHVGDEFQEIQSVEASPFVLGVAGDVYALKRQLADAEQKLSEVKIAMLDEIGINSNIDDAQFETLISQHRISASLVQQYLMHNDRCNKHRKQLSQANEAVFSETITQINLPARIKLHGL